MTWHDVDIYFTVVAAIVGGVIAGWYVPGSLRHGLSGAVVAVIVSVGLTFVPRAVSTIELWLYIPQEVSLKWGLWFDAVVSFPLAVLFVGIGFLFGFGLACCKHCRSCIK